MNTNATDEALVPNEVGPSSPSKLTLLRKDTRGLSTVEYLILLVVIAVASISLWKEIGDKVKGHATDSNDALGKIGTSTTSP